jgi:hypothetical protein
MTLKQATLWQRAAIALAEEELATLKAPLADPTAALADFAGIRRQTQQLARLEQLQGDELVGEFEAQRHEHPRLTNGMVRAVAARDRALLHGLWCLLEEHALTPQGGRS